MTCILLCNHHASIDAYQEKRTISGEQKVLTHLVHLQHIKYISSKISLDYAPAKLSRPHSPGTLLFWGFPSYLITLFPSFPGAPPFFTLFPCAPPLFITNIFSQIPGLPVRMGAEEFDRRIIINLKYSQIVILRQDGYDTRSSFYIISKSSVRCTFFNSKIITNLTNQTFKTYYRFQKQTVKVLWLTFPL